MWTKAHRARPEARLKDIVSVQAVGQGARWLERRDPPRGARATPYRAGCARSGLASAGGRGLAGVAFRPCALAYRLWLVPALAGTGPIRCPAAPSCCAVLLRQVARRRRRALGRKPEPGLAIIDTQSLACLPVRSPRGYEAATKGLGRKRVALVDA